MERGKIHASPQSYSVKGKEHDSLSAVFISPSLSLIFFFGRICVLYQMCELDHSHISQSLVHTSYR